MADGGGQQRREQLLRKIRGAVAKPRTSAPHTVWRSLASAQICCQKGGRVHNGMECVTCPRFIDAHFSLDRTQVTVLCRWDRADCIGGLMTMASHIVRVAPDDRIVDADQRARRAKVRHVVVTEDDQIHGVVCRCQLVPPVLAFERVRDRMSQRIFSLPPWATIAETTELMIAESVGCVLVMDNEKLYGIVSRGDLRRAGIDPKEFGIDKCPQCHSFHGVRPHPQLSGLEFCIDCLDEVFTAEDYDELPA